MSTINLDASLVKRRANPNAEGDDAGLDVFGKLGQVVDDIIMSKEKKTERQVMRRVQNDQRNVFSEQDRIARCQRVRGVIVRVLAAMGYEMKIENKDDNEVLKLVQGNRILELPEE